MTMRQFGVIVIMLASFALAGYVVRKQGAPEPRTVATSILAVAALVGGLTTIAVRTSADTGTSAIHSGCVPGSPLA